MIQPASNHSVIFGNATREAFVLDKVGTAPIRVAVRVSNFLIINESVKN